MFFRPHPRKVALAIAGTVLAGVFAMLSVIVGSVGPFVAGITAFVVSSWINRPLFAAQWDGRLARAYSGHVETESSPGCLRNDRCCSPSAEEPS